MEEVYNYSGDMADIKLALEKARYRIEEELEQWRLKDPIERVRAYLMRSGAADAAFVQQVEQEADALADRVRTECRALLDPAPEAMFAHVYAEPHTLVDTERHWWQEYLGDG